ncbi:MAG: hypothetical protein JKY67_05815 [Pseudomonadales bacterium]|nr:hypothetical protein [Pseudomonadales bacterium]
MIRKVLWGITFCFITLPTLAHQPVMDMAPRWKSGWGFQIRDLHYGSNTLLEGSSKITNSANRKQSLRKTWLEGIYTFRREVRLTLKLPYIDQSRTVIRDGSAVREFGSGIGDLIIGLPLKRYENKSNSTGNLAFTPSLRLPTGGNGDDFPAGDGSTDIGLSFSASFEKLDLYQYYDLFYWSNSEGDRGIHQGDELGLDINIGWHPYHNNLTNTGVFLMADLSVRYEELGQNDLGLTGGNRISVGPVFVWYQGGIMFRAEYKTLLDETKKGIQLSQGDEYSVGIGFVF